jgi:hypothetical protein
MEKIKLTKEWCLAAAKQEQDDIDAFHKHLDQCQQCENNPFDLCLVGAGLLAKAATCQNHG